MTRGESSDSTEPSEFAGGGLLESVIVVVSVILIIGILGYLGSQAVTEPSTPNPIATIDSVDSVRADDPRSGSVRVTVALDNRGETGLSSVAVAVQCGETERSLVFTRVPARGHRTGTVICPRGTTPTASVTTWIEA
jgi:hypothetical protein